MAIACPICQFELPENVGLCPHCRNYINLAHWQEESYSTLGLQPQITLIHGGTPWRGTGNSFVIGRESLGGLDLNAPTVSRQHVIVELIDNVWRIRKVNDNVKDFHINGIPIQTAELHSGDELNIGGVILSVEIKYQQLPCPTLGNGTLKRLQPVPLDQSRITIGSKTNCDVVIDTSVGFTVLVYKNQNQGSWWIVDCNSPYALYVNNKRVRNKQLYYGDRISVAGVEFVFSQQGLESSLGTSSTGFSIQTQKLSAVSNQGFPILENVSFLAKPGEFVGVLGPSGCGKSSLIQRIIGLALITSGNCLINGQTLDSCKSVFLSQCAYLPQETMLHKSLTVAQELNCYCDLHPTECLRSEIPSVLKMVGLESEFKKRVGALSGGQQKRLGIALELLRRPQVLLLDEPTSGLDPATETEVMLHLERIAHQGKTVLCSTHQMDNFNLFDKVLILSRGRLVYCGSPNDALTHFENKYHVQTPQDIYKLLASGSYDEQKLRAKALADEFEKSEYTVKNPTFVEPIKKQTTSKSAISNFFSQVKGYFKRSWDEFFGFIHSEHCLRDFLYSSFFIQIFFLPVLISLAIKFSCASKWWSEFKDAGDLFFFCLISVFWLGMNNSIRELVSERTPGRCLERIERVPMSAYLVSKLLWITLLCATQTALFSLLTFTFVLHPTIWQNAPDSDLVVNWSYEMYFILLGTSLIGAWIALAVSAIFKNSGAAIAMLPIILIPILLFSKPVMNLSDSCDPQSLADDNEKNFRVAITCYYYSPCYAPLELFRNVNEYNKNKQENKTDFIEDSKAAVVKSLPNYILTHVVCFLITITVTVYFQRKNELEWEGR